LSKPEGTRIGEHVGSEETSSACLTRGIWSGDLALSSEYAILFVMTSRPTLKNVPASIVPIDSQTYAIFSYAESPEAQAAFEQARREIAAGDGIEPTPEYFADLNRRIAEIAKRNEQEA
jgi:hypothetical protein